jgi:hypothetical protein
MSCFSRFFLVLGLLYLPLNWCFGQNTTASQNFSFASLEYTVGKTSPANFNFPETNLQQGITFSIGKTNYGNQSEWTKQLNHPKTGLTFSYTDFGNSDKIGKAFTVMPFLDFQLSNRFHLKTGIGMSYFNTIFDPVTNPNNQAISSHFVWAFRSFLYYDLAKNSDFDFQLSAGYFHNSNGHVRLPNYGLNSFLVGFNSQYNFKKAPVLKEEISNSNYSSQWFFSYRVGVGERVLTEGDEAKKVYVVSASAGKIINKTFKFGGGIYYRFYQDYYDYIKKEGTLVTDFYPYFKENPALYASNLGIFANSEIVMNHVGVEFELGFNLFKPSYKMDWQLNEGVYVNNVKQLGELNWYYELKRSISSKLGLKYYLFSNNKSPKHNLFLGAFINANLGQADFSELSLGYVYCPKMKRKK